MDDSLSGKVFFCWRQLEYVSLQPVSNTTALLAAPVIIGTTCASIIIVREIKMKKMI